MGNYIDKSLIINRLKLALGLANDAELASFLGVKANTLSNWKSRNNLDYDLIFTKCDSLDFHWLITGEELKDRNSTAISSSDKDLYTFELQKKHIEKLESEIERLKIGVTFYKKELESADTLRSAAEGKSSYKSLKENE